MLLKHPVGNFYTNKHCVLNIMYKSSRKAKKRKFVTYLIVLNAPILSHFINLYPSASKHFNVFIRKKSLLSLCSVPNIFKVKKRTEFTVCERYCNQNMNYTSEHYLISDLLCTVLT
jgi:hypothetical protein